MKMGAEMGCKIKWQYIVFNYNEKHIEVKFPFTVTPDIVKNIVKKSDSHNPIPFGMFV